MTYNFDEIIDRRHTNALNTDGFRGYIFHAGPEKVFAFKDEEFVRMWILRTSSTSVPIPPASWCSGATRKTPPAVCGRRKSSSEWARSSKSITFG